MFAVMTASTRVTEAISFSNPNLPVLSPVRYPTEANYYYGPSVIRIAAVGFERHQLDRSELNDWVHAIWRFDRIQRP